MEYYTCEQCGYYYDSDYGDEENHIYAGTAFEQLPTDWVCPECAASKSEFVKLDQEEFDTYDVFDDYDLVIEDSVD